MTAAQSLASDRRTQKFVTARYRLCAGLLVIFSLVCPPTKAQALAGGTSTSTSCPVQFLHFDPNGVSVKVRNVSDKMIVGLVFNAALADATEHWRWLHWNLDDARPVEDFGWNKQIKVGDIKNLSWDRRGLNFEHGGGGAFVVTSVLFADGSRWEETGDSASCKYVWYNDHKKFFAKPVYLPFR
jgi:hypothetical protein